MNYKRPELRERLASEYVLGTLGGRARKRFQRLLADDADLRATVAFWERELIPMAAPLSVPAPSDKVWAGIAARVAPREAAASAKASWIERWFSSRMLGSLVAGLFIGVGVTLVAPELQDAANGGADRTQLPASYAGILQDSSGNATMLVSSLRHGKVVDIKVLRPIAVGPDQVLQLWALPKEAPPFALGIVPAQGKGRLTLPASSEELLAKVGELAVSTAPRGAVPDDKPAGPFILRGACAKFW